MKQPPLSLSPQDRLPYRQPPLVCSQNRLLTNSRCLVLVHKPTAYEQAPVNDWSLTRKITIKEKKGNRKKRINEPG
jgi:hypothetical protein